MASLGEAGIEHHECQSFDHVTPKCSHVITRIRGKLSDQDELGTGRLGIGEHVDEWVLMARNVEARSFGGGSDSGGFLSDLALRRWGKVLLDLALNRLGIEVAHGDNSHQIGPVPALVEILQALGGGVLDNFREANGAPFGVLRVTQNYPEQVVSEAGVEALSQTPFLQHNAPLQLHFLRFEGYCVGPVAEDLKCLLGDLRVVGWNLYKVNSDIEACISVYVGAEGAANGLQIFDDLLLGESFGAIKSHVLYEVGQALLVLLLVD